MPFNLWTSTRSAATTQIRHWSWTSANERGSQSWKEWDFINKWAQGPSRKCQWNTLRESRGRGSSQSAQLRQLKTFGRNTRPKHLNNISLRQSTTNGITVWALRRSQMKSLSKSIDNSLLSNFSNLINKSKWTSMKESRRLGLVLWLTHSHCKWTWWAVIAMIYSMTKRLKSLTNSLRGVSKSTMPWTNSWPLQRTLLQQPKQQLAKQTSSSRPGMQRLK